MLFAKRLKQLKDLYRHGLYPAQSELEKEEFATLITRMEEVYFNDGFFQNIALDLLSQPQPDLFALYLHGTDAISHAFYKFHFPEENFDVTPQQLKFLAETIADIYQMRDTYLGQLLEVASPDTTWIILSDHGFQRQRFSTEFLMETRFLYDMDAILKMVGLLTFTDQGEIDRHSSICFTSKQYEWYPVTFLQLIPPTETKDEYEDSSEMIKRRKQVLEAFQIIIFEGSGKPVFHIEEIQKKDRKNDFRVYPLVNKENYGENILINGISKSISNLFSVAPLSGTHQLEGVLVMSGPGIRPGAKIPYNINTLDIAPTVLALAGLPVGKDMTGRIIEKALPADYLERYPIQLISSYENIEPLENRLRADHEPKEPPGVRNAIVKRYKDLGYLGN